jgi:hypothetical protein
MARQRQRQRLQIVSCMVFLLGILPRITFSCEAFQLKNRRCVHRYHHQHHRRTLTTASSVVQDRRLGRSRLGLNELTAGDDDDDNDAQFMNIDNARKAMQKKDRGPGSYDPNDKFGEQFQREKINVGDPQLKVVDKERSVNSILQELAAIQRKGPQKYCILGTRHCSYLHQQIIELLYVSYKISIHCADGFAVPRVAPASADCLSHAHMRFPPFVNGSQSLRPCIIRQPRIHVRSRRHPRGYYSWSTACGTRRFTHCRVTTIHDKTNQRVTRIVEKSDGCHCHATK